MSSAPPSSPEGSDGDPAIPGESHPGTGSHRAPKPNRKLLQRLPFSAGLGLAALAVTGFGVVHTSSSSVEDAVTAEPPTLSSAMTMSERELPRLNSPEISRSISRTTLKKQAETQAKQREEALQQLSEQSEDRADELIKQKKARERREAREEAAESESDDGLAASAEAPDGAVSAGQWVLPVAGYTLTATFGETSSYWETYHTGLDFAAASGTPLVAVTSGTITSAGYDGAYGNKTVLTLDDGTEIWYCHQTSIEVSEGQEVAPGDQIGTVGATGNVTGPHLHLEVRPGGGDPIDPYTALQEHGVTP